MIKHYRYNKRLHIKNFSPPDQNSFCHSYTSKQENILNLRMKALAREIMLTQYFALNHKNDLYFYAWKLAIEYDGRFVKILKLSIKLKDKIHRRKMWFLIHSIQPI